MKYKARVAVLVVVLIACISIIYQHKFRRHRRQEHKCKEPKPKPAEPSTSRYPPDTEVPLPPSPSVLHVFQTAAVTSDSDICSKIGRDILQRRGNAVDSALATLTCNGLVTMQSMGIGGGFIMNIYKRNENVSLTIMARETAPSATKLDLFCIPDEDTSIQGRLSIAVPGEVMGYYEAHSRFGSLSWEKILQPTIDICQDGFRLSKHQWDSLFFNPRVLRDSLLREMFVNRTTGGFIRVGSMVHPPPQLCETYKTLAKNGPQDFYTGDLAQLVADDLRDIGSIIRLKDLQNYEAGFYRSIAMNFGRDTLHLVPPVGSGLIVGHVLNILKGYNFREKISPVTLTHRIIEALKYGFARRWELGDIELQELERIVSNMTSSEWAKELRFKIDDTVTCNEPSHYGGQFAPLNDQGTGHISVLAPNGDAVSVTSTIHYYFGSGIMGNRTGILFNSAMGDFTIPCLPNYFSLPPSKANLAQPNRYPMSSMSPTIVTDLEGEVKLVVGGAGGPKIVSALVNILLRVLWFGEDIKQAIDAPRFHHQLEPNAFEYEYGLLREVVDGLEKIGHKTLRYRERGSVFCGIMKNATAVYANVDFRKLGGVAGF